ncbi:hypothetical protein [Paenibacillus xylanexedens]|uniref:hypothetical protein n=1 Tax=Paenibacillus xylanexedens TaxID=528191 RepID=UPI0011A41E1B|nr:hypothetical protein [Paenibacillus xylanexedens]
MKKPIYKKWWFWLIIALVVAGLGNMNNAPDPEKPTPTSAVVTTNEQVDKGNEKVKEDKQNTQALDKEVVLAYTANIRGRTFVEEVLVGDHNINVEFYDTYDNYKSANPQSKVSEEDYINYFSTGDEINKILMEESSRLLKQFTSADTINIAIPFEGKTYSVDLEKSIAETYFDVDFSALNSDPEAWKSQLSSKYFNKKDRQKFVDEFVQIN